MANVLSDEKNQQVVAMGRLGWPLHALRRHEQAFRRLCGAPRVVVLDSLREGVIEPEVYDPVLNPLFRDLLKHYSVTALPARVGHPDRKGRVESGVGHAQKTPLKGMRFETIEEAQTYLDRWEERWADTRIHGTTRRQVAAMFARVLTNTVAKLLVDGYTAYGATRTRGGSSSRHSPRRPPRPDKRWTSS